MKIGIDLLPLQSDPNHRGISNFTYNTVKSIIEIDRINEYVLFNAKGVKLSPEFIMPNVHIYENSITKETSRELDIFHYTSFFDFEKKIIYPSNIECIKIVTIYDLIPAIFWENYINFFPEDIKHEYFRRLGYLERFDKILTISETSKKDIIDILDIHSNKIDVIYAGIDNKFNISNDINVDISKFGINKKYIMSTPSMDFRKNIYRLIDAYAKLPKEYKDEYQLVIVCELTKQFHKLLIDHTMFKGISDKDIVLTNYVSEDELISLYNKASVFVFPSLYEGFGLPILEAMICKVPVITSNNSSLAEIAGDAAILVDPYNVEEISDAIQTVLSDNNIRDNIIKKGSERAKKFSWKNVAELTIKAYEKSFNRYKLSKKLGMITTWNAKCGIAEYSKYLLEEFSVLDNIIEVSIFSNFEKNIVRHDETNVIRCWSIYTDELHRLYEEIKLKDLDIVHFQFNYGLFNMESFVSLIKKLKNDRIKIICTFHSTEDVEILHKKIKLNDFSKGIKLIDKILVHTKKDMNKLLSIGVDNNVLLVPQGYKTFQDVGKYIIRKEIGLHNSLIISTFGFMLPHKGILETIKSLSILKQTYTDILFFIVSSIYPTEISEEYYRDCRKEVEKLGLDKNVLFFTQYLEEYEIIELLQISDIIIMPYKETKESSSAAIRLAISSHRPVIVTDVPIFEEFNDEVYKISKCEPKIIADNIVKVFNNQKLTDELTEHSKYKIELENWHSIAQKYNTLLLDLIDHDHQDTDKNIM